MFHTLHRPHNTIALLILAILSVNLFAACSSRTLGGAPLQQTGSCSQSANPQITALTPLQSQKASVYFTSPVHLYALNAGNGTLRWCTEVHTDPGNAAQSNTLSQLSSLAFSNGRLYVNTYENYLDAFNANSGTLLWQYPTHADGLGMNPTVVGNTVYSGSSILYALDAQNGSQIWQYAMEGANGSPVTPTSLSWGNPSSTLPIVVDGVVYVRSTFSSGQTESFSYLHALDAITGQKHWVVATPPCSGLCLAGNLVVVQGRILAPMNGGVLALDAHTGNTLWQWHDPGNNLILLGGANHQLYVVEETKYANGQPVNHPRMYALNAANGAQLWSVPALDDAVRIRTLATDNLFYVAASGTIYAYNTQNGSVLWHTQLAHGGGVSMTGPVLLNHELYIGEEGNTTNGTLLLHALNALNGVENWYATVPGSSILGQMDVAGG